MSIHEKKVAVHASQKVNLNLHVLHKQLCPHMQPYYTIIFF